MCVNDTFSIDMIYLMKNIFQTINFFITITHMADNFGKILYHFAIIRKLAHNKQPQNLFGAAQYMFISYKSGYQLKTG